MTQIEELAAHYQKQLHQNLAQQGVLWKELVNAAFSSVPRHKFIHKYYMENKNGQSTIVKERPGVDALGIEWHQWLQSIYQDVPLVTKIDRLAFPLSSSSMPSLMAKMLNVLDVKPGQRVLEIGTGTGYHAALLCQIVQEPDLITTIELDSELARLAEQRLAPLATHERKSPLVLTGNALEWVGSGHPSCYYDRIIATASWTSIPPLWVHHLALDGILVMEVNGPFISVLVRLYKQQDGQITVNLIPDWNGAFMALRQKPDDDAITQKKIMKNLPFVATYEVPANEFSYEHLRRPGLALLLQYLLPTVRIKRFYPGDKTIIYLIDDIHDAQAQIEQCQDQLWTVTSTGIQDLWAKYQEAVTLWESWGKPDLSAYSVEYHQPEGLLMPMLRPK